MVTTQTVLEMHTGSERVQNLLAANRREQRRFCELSGRGREDPECEAHFPNSRAPIIITVRRNPG